MTLDASPQQRAARSWFGYGRWKAPYWFVGMEPGGTADMASYEAWLELGGGELIDSRKHHEMCNYMKWHGEGPRRTQPTWRRLIQTLLAFENKPTDLDTVCQYQRHRFGRLDDKTAVVELGALHAPGLATKVDRETYRKERIAVLHSRLVEYQPTFALCYGLTFQKQFVEVVGSEFDEHDFAWCSNTLCVITPGPTSHLKGKPTPWAKPAWWIALGQRIRNEIDSRIAPPTSARYPAAYS